MYSLFVVVAILVFGWILTACKLQVLPPIPITNVHGTTIYRIDATLGRIPLTGILNSTLPTIKNSNFNAVMIPAIWADFDPNPLATPHLYNSIAFNEAKTALAKARSYGMTVLVGLNYIGEGFSPDLGLTPACDWAVNPITYAAFERYVEHWLTEMLPWADILRPFVFTEGSEGCGQSNPSHATLVATRLQGTLGSLPSRLLPLLRSVYQIGYHDNTMITLGWANGISPIASPNTFDWLSMVSYNVETIAELDVRLARWRALYPTTPMIVGELGANGCGVGGEDHQAQLNVMGAKWALKNDLGFNVWGWLNAGSAECTNPVYGGLAITNEDGSLRQTVIQIKAILGH